MTIKRKTPAQGGTGSTLDAGNLGAIAFAWEQIVKQDNEFYRGFQLFLGDKNDTSKIMWQHDAELLKALRSWTQSTNIINKAIGARLQELRELAALVDAEKAAAAPFVPTDPVAAAELAAIPGAFRGKRADLIIMDDIDGMLLEAEHAALDKEQGKKHETE